MATKKKTTKKAPSAPPRRKVPETTQPVPVGPPQVYILLVCLDDLDDCQRPRRRRYGRRHYDGRRRRYGGRR